MRDRLIGELHTWTQPHVMQTVRASSATRSFPTPHGKIISGRSGKAYIPTTAKDKQNNTRKIVVPGYRMALPALDGSSGDGAHIDLLRLDLDTRSRNQKTMST